MQQIVTVWANLENRRRIIVGLATIAVLVCLVALYRAATAPTMTLLYAGLESSAAGDVVRALEQQGAGYEIRGNSIFVDSSRRDELRMTLASEGLPANGARGYELLDALTGFGTTSQMFDAAYWRAKEGELARTIVASRHVSQARVHIANTSSAPFVRSAEPSASVWITSSGTLATDQARALQHLVASAVAGLSIDRVAIVDSNGNILTQGEEGSPLAPGQDQAAALRDRVLRLVEARVGAGNAVVEVSVETVTETESIRERRFDPDNRVAISTDTEERTNVSSEQAAGVTVASNLPDGDAAAGEGSSAETSETRERVNYEVSETERELVRAPGAIKRLSVAVLVNGVETIDETGTRAYEDRSGEELQTLRELVASAVGFSEDRGDVITIRSMELPAVLPQGTSVDQPFLAGLELNLMSLIQMAVLAIVALVLALFVIRPILTKAPAQPAGALPDLTGQDDFGVSQPALTGELTSPQQDSALPVFDNDDWSSLNQDNTDPVQRLRNMISDRQEETVEVLRSWLEAEEERT